METTSEIRLRKFCSCFVGFSCSFSSHALFTTRTFAYPVFDSLDPETRKVAGLFSTGIYWRAYFSGILPTKARGVTCVLSNGFNQSLTFRVDGADARYVGSGDLHEQKYDHMGEHADVNDYIARIASKASKSYTSVNLNNDFGRYKLAVYPSAETEDEFLSNLPVIQTLVVTGVIFFTSVVFLFYDYLVRRRQKIVTDRAVASGAIVSSLFPDQVRDKLYSKKESAEDDMFSHHSNQDPVPMNEPIMADFFPCTTICFADLAG